MPQISRYLINREGNNLPQNLVRNQSLLLNQGETVEITAVIEEQKSVTCFWETKAGTLSGKNECTVTHVTPSKTIEYVLDLDVENSCSASLFQTSITIMATE